MVLKWPIRDHRSTYWSTYYLLTVFTNDPTAEALSHPNAKLVSVRLANRTKPDQRADQASRACMI